MVTVVLAVVLGWILLSLPMAVLIGRVLTISSRTPRRAATQPVQDELPLAA